MKKYDELVKEAIEMLNNDDDLFCDCVRELDSWNGFADGFRCYGMDELNDLFYGVTVGDFLDKLAGDFNHNDNYFYDSIYGISSCNSEVDLYRDNTSSKDIFDALLSNYNHLNLSVYSSDFDELMYLIDNYTED